MLQQACRFKGGRHSIPEWSGFCLLQDIQHCWIHDVYSAVGRGVVVERRLRVSPARFMHYMLITLLHSLVTYEVLRRRRIWSIAQVQTA